jgi:hypothetical protein
MSDAALKIADFERQVMKRKRWLALQDRLALAIPISCAAAAAIILFARMREGGAISWPLLAAILIIEFFGFAYHWRKTRATGREAAFLIDNKLELEDRFSTAHEIIEKGGPKREVESALIDDAAGRIADQPVSAIAPYHLKKWHAVSLIAVVALAAALMIPERALPGGEAIAEARASIQSAGEQLEQEGEKIALAAPPESETAQLAKEQAELGRVFRRSPETRAEALNKLSALENRIKKRHAELASGRPDEIVSIADQRLRSALRQLPRQAGKQSDINESEETGERVEAENDSEANPNSNTSPSASRRRANKQPMVKPAGNTAIKGDQARADANKNGARNAVATAKQGERMTGKSGSQAEQKESDARKAEAGGQGQQAANEKPESQVGAAPSKPQNRLQKPDSGLAETAKESKEASGQPVKGQQPQAENSASEKAPAENAAAAQADKKSADAENEQGGEQKPEEKPDSSSGLTGLMAEQTAKALPSMSAELLKKAAELRSGKLTADDLKGLQKAAEMLARDLPKLAQSKELQQAAEQLAKQITPEQLEALARSLGNVEQLKQELEAAARLMMQNQEAKSMVAGMAQKFAKLGEEFSGRNRGEPRTERQENSGTGNQPGNETGGRARGGENDARRREFERLSGGLTSRTDGGIVRSGAGKETKLTGNVQRGSNGEYLYLKSQAGSGAARAPYSSAYPQYRRAAERSVERSKVPAHMRSVVRSYFDAINPDATKKP